MIPFQLNPNYHLMCPYCLHDLSFLIEKKITVCKVCGNEIPPLYKRDYRSTPPLIVQLLGWRQVGKTTYLQALSYLLSFRISNILENCHTVSVTDATLRFERSIEEYLDNGILPEITPLGEQEAFIRLCKNTGRWGSRTLVFRDCAGEVFDPLTIKLFDSVPYLLHAPTSLFLISLPNLETLPGYSMNQLLSSYINTLVGNRIDPRKNRRSVLIVLTKGDLITDLPKEVKDYLENDPICDALTKNEEYLLNKQGVLDYLEKMKDINHILSDWIDKKPGGKSMRLDAQDNKIKICYSIVSSTGKQLVSGEKNSWKPKRILDPFFWTLEFQSK
jgi:hypothetical protein